MRSTPSEVMRTGEAEVVGRRTGVGHLRQGDLEASATEQDDASSKLWDTVVGDLEDSTRQSVVERLESCSQPKGRGGGHGAGTPRPGPFHGVLGWGTPKLSPLPRGEGLYQRQINRSRNSSAITRKTCSRFTPRSYATLLMSESSSGAGACFTVMNSRQCS